MSGQTETMLKTSMKPEAEEIVKLLGEFPEEGRSFLYSFRGRYLQQLQLL